MKPSALIPLALVLLAGCATTPAERISRNRSLFASWPPNVQAAVREGKIGVGFTPEQVQMALGNPDRTFVQTTAQGASEIWIYHSHRPRISVGIGVMGGGGSTRVGGATQVSSGEPYPAELLRVIFRDGRVSAVEERTR